jgi:hypothetical protein
MVIALLVVQRLMPPVSKSSPKATQHPAGVAVGIGLGDGVTVGVLVGVGVSVGITVGVLVAVGVGVSVRVGLGVLVDVGVSVGGRVGGSVGGSVDVTTVATGGSVDTGVSVGDGVPASTCMAGTLATPKQCTRSTRKTTTQVMRQGMAGLQELPESNCFGGPRRTYHGRLTGHNPVFGAN